MGFNNEFSEDDYGGGFWDTASDRTAILQFVGATIILGAVAWSYIETSSRARQSPAAAVVCTASSFAEAGAEVGQTYSMPNAPANDIAASFTPQCRAP